MSRGAGFVAAFGLVRNSPGTSDLSARTYHRVLKISRTIPDLGGSANVEAQHVSETVQYRTLDRR